MLRKFHLFCWCGGWTSACLLVMFRVCGRMTTQLLISNRLSLVRVDWIGYGWISWLPVQLCWLDWLTLFLKCHRVYYKHHLLLWKIVVVLSLFAFVGLDCCHRSVLKWLSNFTGSELLEIDGIDCKENWNRLILWLKCCW